MSTAISEEHRKTTLESQVHYNLALGKITRNRYRDALNHLVESLRMAPSNATYLSYFGFCLAQAEGHYERAIRHCRNAVNIAPCEVMHWVNLGRVYKLKGDNRAAYETFRRAWEVRGKHPTVAAELTRMGIRRPPFLTFLSRQHPVNKYLGMVRATLERKLIGRRQS